MIPHLDSVARLLTHFFCAIDKALIFSVKYHAKKLVTAWRTESKQGLIVVLGRSVEFSTRTSRLMKHLEDKIQHTCINTWLIQGLKALKWGINGVKCEWSEHPLKSAIDEQMVCHSSACSPQDPWWNIYCLNPPELLHWNRISLMANFVNQQLQIAHFRAQQFVRVSLQVAVALCATVEDVHFYWLTCRRIMQSHMSSSATY